jgi:hypothetical protein
MTSKYSAVFLSPLTRTFFAALLIGGPSACGGDGSDGATDGAGGTSAGTTGTSAGTTGTSAGNGGTSSAAPSGELCAADRRVGSFTLRLSDDRKTILNGGISDSVRPSGKSQEIATEGACRLLSPPDLFCSTPCESGMTCAGNNMCVPAPMNQSAGTLTVTGLQVPLEVTLNGITGLYDKTILDPFPAFQPGAAIQLSAAGGAIPAFTLRGWGVPPLVTSLTAVNVSSGSGVPLTWDTAGVNTQQSEIYIWFSVDVHGTTKRWIDCVVPDSGSFTLPATLVSRLIEFGLSGFPRMYIERRTADSTQVSAGKCVSFEVASQVGLNLVVEGLISCSENADCPTGQTCTTEQQCE